MDEQVWFDNPKELFRSDKIFKFWPTAHQTAAQRVNTTTRFVLYAGSVLYLIRRDIRILVLSLMVVGVIYALYKADMVREGQMVPVMSNDYNYSPNCQAPTADNPMGNVLISDIGHRPDRPPACEYSTVRPLVKKYMEDTIPYDCGRSRCAKPEIQRKAAARQFVTGPVTTIPGDQTAFAEWCYGKKFSPMCRDDSSSCDPNSRGVQLDAFAGLAPNSDRRNDY